MKARVEHWHGTPDQLNHNVHEAAKFLNAGSVMSLQSFEDGLLRVEEGMAI